MCRPFVRRLPDWWLLLIAAAIVAVAPLLRDAVDYLQWWGGELNVVDGVAPPGILVHPPIDYVPGLSPGTAVVGLFVAGWFPLFPWLAFPVLGLVLGRRMIVDRPGLVPRWAGMGVLALAAGLTVALTSVKASRGNPVSDHISVFSFTPESTSLLLAQLGIVLLVIAAAHAGLDRA